MRCRACEYVLWNLRARQCPECGEAFLPSQYEFAATTVRFCCPHCDQAYYGTDENGHLSPRAFSCVQCGQDVSMDEMVLRPAEGVHDWETKIEVVPWADARGLSRFGGWFATVFRALFLPHRLLTAKPRSHATIQAWLFALVTSIAVMVGIVGPIMLFTFVIAGMMAGGRGGGGLVALGGMGLGFFMVAIIWMLSVLILAVIWGATAHVLLKWTGPMQSGIGRTYQAICYSSGANVATTIPCLGWYFGWVWWVVSAVFMIKAAQGVSAGRAVLAGITFPIVSIIAFVVLMFVAGQVTPAYQPTQFGSLGASNSTARMVRAAQTYARNNGGAFPSHAAELMVAGNVEPMAFLVLESQTNIFNVPLGSGTLLSYSTTPVQVQQQDSQKLVDAMPEHVIAHRLGDFVFCWHGLNVDSDDGALWILIASPDPDLNASKDVGGLIHVGRLNGTQQGIAAGEWNVRLAEQNALRASYGLAPLPQPDTVRHNRPATDDAGDVMRGEE